MQMQKLQTMSAVQVGDEFASLDGRIWKDCGGYPVTGAIPGFGRVRITHVGAHWSSQPQGCSGYYVAYVAAGDGERRNSQS